MQKQARYIPSCSRQSPSMFLSFFPRYVTRRSPALLSTFRTMAILKQVVAKESDLKDGEQ